jgi:Concanavalin A-like lectin/glucanases superfamily/Carboxypeptidase regulatory-like domain
MVSLALLASGLAAAPANAAPAPSASNTAPNAPDSLTSDAKPCATGAARPYVLTSTPTLGARQSDPDSGQSSLRTDFYWWPLGGWRSEMNKLSRTSMNPSLVSVTIPEGRLTDSQAYVWQARTYDGSRFGRWSSTCEFTVDVIPPPAPAAVTSTDYPADKIAGGVGFPGTFRVSPPASQPGDIVAYAYSLDSGVSPLGAPTVAPAADFTASITLAPEHDGINTLRVWTLERSGRFSSPFAYTFVVRARPGPAADWVFDEASGDASDATGHGNTAVLAGGAARVAGRSGVGQALSLDGTGAYAATDGPVLTPDPDTGTPVPVTSNASFTATAWVWLAATGGGIRTVVSYDGTSVHAQRLAYDGSTNTWFYGTVRSDANGATESTISSTSTATAGRWTHLAMVWDAWTRQMRLYVNGTLEATTTLAADAVPHGSASSLSIGRTKRDGVHTDFWSGAIDDVRVYNYAASAEALALLAAPAPPAVSFPDGSTATVGQPIAVRFDAGGDTNVTSYRYSVESTALGSTATPATPGGPVTVTVTPTIRGEVVVYAVAVGANGRQSTLAVGRIEVTGPATVSVSGMVFDGETFLPVEGALVTLEPGGLSLTTGPDGGYSFTGLPAGEITLTATLDGKRDQVTLTVDGDLSWILILWPVLPSGQALVSD